VRLDKTLNCGWRDKTLNYSLNVAEKIIELTDGSPSDAPVKVAIAEDLQTVLLDADWRSDDPLMTSLLATATPSLRARIGRSRSGPSESGKASSGDRAI
jgi:hypothetical protein